MNPIEKLREDVAYWQGQVHQAREALRVGEPVLKNLLEALREAGGGGAVQQAGENQAGEARQEDPQVLRPVEPDQGATNVQEDAPSFTGSATAQVNQALAWKSPQSSEELEESLASFGRKFSRGAVGYAIRDLRKTKKIREANRVGNLRYYEPIPEEGDRESGRGEDLIVRP